MKLLVTMFTSDEEQSVAEQLHQEKCKKFIEGGLISVYDEVMKSTSDYDRNLRTTTIKGGIIGASAVGLIGLGILCYRKFSKNKKSKIVKDEA